MKIAREDENRVGIIAKRIIRKPNLPLLERYALMNGFFFKKCFFERTKLRFNRKHFHSRLKNQHAGNSIYLTQKKLGYEVHQQEIRLEKEK